MIHAAAQGLKTEIAFAGFWRRFLAYLIDATVLFGIYASINITVRVLAPDNVDAMTNVGAFCAAVGWAYYALMESSPARGTLGKLALNLYVGDLHGDPITFRRAVWRNLLKTLSTLLLGTGWIMAAFTPRKQALHDLLAGTLVLRRVNYLVVGPEAPTEPGDHWDGTRWVASVPPSLERT
ncbi:MAG: RDD family protein [Chloroflexi bacterium]|nr:MAG: RDD family protein [Chloroflexota bacterium]TMF23372.1 MAG: RDD family protein [Chloroflexota bacterium]TMG00225.1 MAG: RDD family protein [Chloroflexota bacterium]